MDLSFDFSAVQTAVIYSDDDPDYMIGKKEQAEAYKLTERQKQIKKMFLHVIKVVRKKELDINVDKLIEATRDYVEEWRDLNEQFGWAGKSVPGYPGLANCPGK